MQLYALKNVNFNNKKIVNTYKVQRFEQRSFIKALFGLGKELKDDNLKKH